MPSQEPVFSIVTEYDLDQAFSDLRARWDGTVTRTLVGKIRFHDPHEREVLEWAATLVTSMTSTLLELLCEQRTVVHQHRAFGCVLTMLQQKRDNERKGTRVQVLTQVLKDIYGEHPLLNLQSIPLAATLRDGVFRSCAVMIWLWYSNVQKMHYPVDGAVTEALSEDGATNDPVEHDTLEIERRAPAPARSRKTRIKAPLDAPLPTVADVHAQWLQKLKQYEQAAQTTIFFGRHRGKKLVDVQKRDLRWFKERLVSKEITTKALQAVRVLLYPNPDNLAEYHEAKRHPHPWKKTLKEHRSVRSHAFDNQTSLPKNKRVLLGELGLVELDMLNDELSDAVTFAQEYEKVRQAITWFLVGSPPAFPHVLPVPHQHQKDLRERRHSTALERFRRPFGAKGKATRDILADRLHAIERDARNEVLRTETALRTSYHPLTFNKIFHWYQKKLDLRGANILIHQQTGELRVVCAIYGRYAQKVHAGFDVNDDWRLLTNPEHAFDPSVALVSFGIEIGQSMYQHLMKLKPESTTIPIQLDPPSPVLQQIQITHRSHGSYSDWYSQITLQSIMPVPDYEPHGFLAFHHHLDGYSYAYLDRQTRHIEMGDVLLPVNIPTPATYRASHNYAYEVVHAMLAIAQKHQHSTGLPYLGLEQTMWRKRAPAASRLRNRRFFGYPTQKIADTLRDKAGESGYYPPVMVWNCKPHRDCGRCGHRHPSQRGATRVRPITTCFACNHRVRQQSETTVACTHCGRVWKHRDWIFSCGECGYRMLARYNTARYLVQRIPQQIVADWHWREEQRKD